MTFQLDEQKLEAFLFDKASKVANDAAQYALGRIKRHAPVRKIFKGSAYRKSELFSRYASPAGVAKEAINKRVRTPGSESGAILLGHPNSMEPVFRTSRGTRVTGDFRRVRVMGTALPGGGLLVGSRQLARVPFNESVVHRGGRLEDISQGGKANASLRLTGKGRFEVRSGRANFTGSDGVGRVGGKLRGSIFVHPAERVGDEVWAWVVSPVKYSRPMEFGTVHNRPYPYMRPGLAESRDAFKRLARNAFHSPARRS